MKARCSIPDSFCGRQRQLPLRLAGVALAGAVALGLAVSGQAQTSIAQNNLIQNGAFDTGTSWSHTGGGGFYLYTFNTANPDNETNTICSYGWWTGYSMWQNTAATLLENVDYVATIRARTGDGNMGGLNLSIQDPSTGWNTLTNQDFWFPDSDKGKSPGPWRIYSFRFNSAQVPGNVGDQIGVGIMMETNMTWGPEYGWLHLDWVQLAPAIPYFTSQPPNVTNYSGAAASLTCDVVGAVTNSTGPGSTLQFQWYKSPSTLLANATNKTLSFTALDATNGGSYYVVASGPFGSSQSSNATVVVLAANPPVVTQAPEPQTAWIHQTVKFSVAVAGTPPFSYQWKSNTTAIAGATNATLTLTDISAASETTYTVVVTNQFGSTNTAAALTVLTPASGSYEAGVLGLQPLVYLRLSDVFNTNLVWNEGTLGRAADSLTEGGVYAGYGPIPPSYPFFEDTNPCVQLDGSSGDIAVPALNISTNAGNTVSMTAWVTTYGPQLPYAGIVFQRGGIGSTASGLDVHTNGAAQNVLAYHWGNSFWDFDSGLVIPDYQWCFVALVVTPTNATLYVRDAIGMSQAVNTATHSTCTFSGTTYIGWDSNGNATDRRFNGLVDEVTIFGRALSATEVNELYAAAVGAPPEIVTQPAGVTTYTGLPFELSVVASGAPPLHFQWRRNGSAINGATNSVYAVATAAVTNSGNYDVQIKNAGGTNNSVSVNVTVVVSAPLFTSLPSATNVWAGVPTALAATATGSAPLSYQWLKNNNPLTDQTNATLSFADPGFGDDGDYVLRVTNTSGQTNSPSVHLTVLDPAQYPQMLYYTNGNYTLRSNYSPIQGVWFQTGAKSRVVTHLGYFDASGTGFLTNHYVGIYQGPPGGGTLLGEVLLSMGTSYPSLNGYRWAPLATPLVLQANTNYVLAASDNDADAWPDAYVPQWNPVYVGATPGSTRYVMWDWPYQAWPHEPASTGQGWGDNRTYGIFNLGSFPMTMQKAGGGYQLVWTLGTLTSATNVAGPYVAVPGAGSPYTLPLTGPRQFYRVQYQ